MTREHAELVRRLHQAANALEAPDDGAQYNDGEILREAASAIEALEKERDTLSYRGPGSPSHRLEWLLSELERLFPDAHNPVMSDPSEPKYIAAIERCLSSAGDEASK